MKAHLDGDTLVIGESAANVLDALIEDGASNKQIARRVYLSAAQVERHIGQMTQALGLDRAALAVQVIRGTQKVRKQRGPIVTCGTCRQTFTAVLSTARFCSRACREPKAVSA